IPPFTETHPLRDGDHITEWTTDVFPAAGPGTDVVFRVSDGLTGQVVWKGNSCGNNAAGGTTLSIDLMQGTNRIGRVLYGHLGGTTPALWQNLSTGAVLGQTIPVPNSSISGCYEVSSAADTHIHFELGTRKDTVGTANSACWASYSRTALREPSAKLGQFGQTGFPSPRVCP
ncbi:MAG TPA: hypothetical protein VNM90_24465, partial [Haliangium sp.]|nr:hypothetical protein [Haliangium sp.]